MIAKVDEIVKVSNDLSSFSLEENNNFSRHVGNQSSQKYSNPYNN